MTERQPLAERLRVLFAGELAELVRALNADLLALEAHPTDTERISAVFREAHTLKGAARAAGVPLVERVSHAMETVLAGARDGSLALAHAHFAHFFAVADALDDARTRLAAGTDLAGGPLESLAASPGGAAPKAVGTAETKRESSALFTEERRADASVRFRSETLDALLASTGQLLVSEGRLASRPAEMGALAESAARLAADWRRSSRRVVSALGMVESSAAATRAVRDATDRLTVLARALGTAVAELAGDARTVARASADVVDQVRRMRMRPLADAFERLNRVVRDIATAESKEIEVVVSGGDVEADSAVLEGLNAVLLQLVRNAGDHGIEPPAERERKGKPRRGRISVEATLSGGRIVITVSDDGAGLNVPAIREQLERRGTPVPADERELARAIFEGGLSTRADATVISGRGVGLDIVRAWAEQIRGTVDVAWREGLGTTFTVECPPTLATLRALLVAVGSQTLALPTSHVVRVARIDAHEIRQAEGRDVILTPTGPVPLVALSRLLSTGSVRATDGVVLVVVLAAGERVLAVAVDALLAEQEIVVHPLGPLAQTSPLLAGGALLVSGRVALVLNPPAVVAAGHSLVAGGASLAATSSPKMHARRCVLVVDDSITTRTLEQSILEAAGYDVRTAVDGEDGWRILQEQGADAVVADIEMPRMDGFALCAAIRASRRFVKLPVVLVTALESPKDRARGLDVGADAYIGKSSFDQEHLIETLRQLVAEDSA